MRNLAELAGFALIVGFLYLLWWPLTLLGGGVLLVVWANLTQPRPSAAADPAEDGGSA